MNGGHLNSPEEPIRSSAASSTHDDDHSSSSATSPSTLGAKSSPRSNRGRNSSFTKEAEEFLSNLDNFLPLGCLAFEDLTESDEDQGFGQWNDITQLPPLSAFDETLYSHVQKLAVSGWIRVYSARSFADPRYLVYRVWILPFDVGLRYIDRQSKRLYTALECLIGEIDVTTEAWQGNYSPETSSKFDMWASPDEGSLFYMFNKIPSPSPSLVLVEENYAREALEDLLDPRFEVPGMKTQLYPYQRKSAGLMLQRETVAKLVLDPRLETRTAPRWLRVLFWRPATLYFCAIRVITKLVVAAF